MLPANVRNGRPVGLFPALFGLSLAMLAFAAWGPVDSAAQKPQPRKGAKDGGEKPKKPRAVEEEETDGDLDETTPISLATEVKSATAGPIKDFLKSLAIPHDDLTMRAGRVDHIEPFERYMGPDPVFSGTIAPTRIDLATGKRVKQNPISRKDVSGAVHYEEIALRRIGAFFEQKAKPRLEALLAAEKALIFALRFHARDRKGKADHVREWKKMEEGLRLKWIEIRRERVAALADAERWDDAFRLADLVARDKENPKLLKTFDSQVDVQLDLPRLALRKADKTRKLDDYEVALYRLREFERQFAKNAKAGPIRKGLKARATELMEQGLALAKTDKSGSIDKLREARRIWPELEGLQEALGNLDNECLYVGVRDLPRLMSPALACTDSEKQAVELLFDSLVKRVPAGRGQWAYRPALADGRPRIIPLGRELFLDNNAKWSDGARLTAADIRHTVSLLKKPELPGRNTAWAKLLEDPRIEGGPNQIHLTLRNGFLDPLSLMTFKILPEKWAKDRVLKSADDPAFAAAPLGSGPYFLDRETKPNGSAVVFKANPHYQECARRSGRPFIPEIRFQVSKNPVQDLLAQPTHLHLLLDLPTTRVKTLIDGGFRPQNIITRLPPRVYFLAVNHSKDALQNVKLRKAIGHAIDREAILAPFRAGFQGLDSQNQLKTQIGPEEEKLHPALNGPYPLGSWAFNPNVRASLYDLALAKTLATEALKDVAEVSLKLKYPNDDPRAAEACKAICAQVARLGSKLKIDPIGLAPHDFREAIFERNYELAYCHFDYTSAAFWLWPLFDPDPNARKPGGSNFMRYEDQKEGQLAKYFGEAMNRRDFNEIRKVTHEIHAHISDIIMPLIPLWQLHSHMAVHPHLKTGEVDPLLVFTNVANWKLQK